VNIANKKFWEELILLLSLHEFTENKLVTIVTTEHKKFKPTAEQDSPNKFETQYVLNDCSNYCIEVPFNIISFVLNSIKMYQTVQKLLVGDTQIAILE
jgi:L-cysteine desulfidase